MLLTRSVLTAALLSLFPTVAAPAQSIQTQTLEIRVGVFCDTQPEVERFIALFDGDESTTARAVNAEAPGDATPCGLAAIAVIRGPEVAAVRTWHATFHVVQVTVVGVVHAE